MRYVSLINMKAESVLANRKTTKVIGIVWTLFLTPWISITDTTIQYPSVVPLPWQPPWKGKSSVSLKGARDSLT